MVYDQPSDQVPDLIGRIGMYAEICAIIQGLLMGVIIDTLGRKIPLIFGQVEAAVAIAAIPLFKQVYPWFFICRCLISLGTVIAVNMPFLPDYVDKGSIGLANSYGQVIMSSALIFSSTGLYQISAQISDANQKYVYFTVGGLIGVVALYLIYGIKDVIYQESRPNESHINTILTEDAGT